MGGEPAPGDQRRASDVLVGAVVLEQSAGLPVGTYRVSELAEDLKTVLAEVYPFVWVMGEIQRMHTSARGHLYFELVEKGPREAIIGKLDCVIFRADLARVQQSLRRTGQELGEGREVRCRGSVDFFPAGGRLQFIGREVDAVFSLGLLERRRREVLEYLRQAGLQEKNRALEMAEVPLRVGLLTSKGSAAYHDFVSSLEESGYAFELRFLHTPVQGADAASRLVRALRAMQALEIDCVVVTRGGGARSDLAAFDTREVAEAIATAPFPVLTGLGHETDDSIADSVAHRAFKTPTKVAEFLVQRVADVEAALARLAAALHRQSSRPLERSRHRLDAVAARLPAVRGRVLLARRRVEALSARSSSVARLGIEIANRRQSEVVQRLRRAAPRRVSETRPALENLVRRVADLSRAQVREQRVRIEALKRMTEELAPARVLARGFSVTRAGDGRLLRSSADVAVGDALTTELVSGHLTSRVENAGKGDKEA